MAIDMSLFGKTMNYMPGLADSIPHFGMGVNDFNALSVEAQIQKLQELMQSPMANLQGVPGVTGASSSQFRNGLQGNLNNLFSQQMQQMAAQAAAAAKSAPATQAQSNGPLPETNVPPMYSAMAQLQGMGAFGNNGSFQPGFLNQYLGGNGTSPFNNQQPVNSGAFPGFSNLFNRFSGGGLLGQGG